MHHCNSIQLSRGLGRANFNCTLCACATNDIPVCTTPALRLGTSVPRQKKLSLDRHRCLKAYICDVSDQKERKSLEDKYSPVEKAGKFIAG